MPAVFYRYSISATNCFRCRFRERRDVLAYTMHIRFPAAATAAAHAAHLYAARRLEGAPVGLWPPFCFSWSSALPVRTLLQLAFVPGACEASAASLCVRCPCAPVSADASVAHSAFFCAAP